MERPRGAEEQERAAEDLARDWRYYRLERGRIRAKSVPLTELFDACLGVRTTSWGPAVALKMRAVPQPHDELGIPDIGEGIQVWALIDNRWRYLSPPDFPLIGTLRKMWSTP